MKLPNLKEIMISLTEFKKQIASLVEKQSTKVIIKNNEPVAVFMPYDEYLHLTDSSLKTGEDITLSNGVTVKVYVEESEGNIVTKTYIKRKTTGDYQLHFTHSLGIPPIEQTLTIEEQIQLYELTDQNDSTKKTRG